MPQLTDAYDAYKDLSRNAFFTVCFDTLPSNLSLELPLPEKKENMLSVMESIDFERFKLKTVLKNWRTEDAKNSDFSKDYAYEYLFKSETHKLIFWMTLGNGELYISFLYDAADAETEQWVLESNHLLRSKFGEERAPVFQVLSRNKHGFYTEEVRTTNFESIKLNELYNDDFEEVDKIICESMSKNESGLILLHGVPGTGKTSYLKSLISKLEDKSFIFIQNEFIRELLHPDFISFLLNHKDVVLVIEDAEKVITSREYSSETSFVSTILQLTDGLFSDYLNIKIVCTFNTNIEKVDKALLRKGRMIANYEFKALSREKTKKLMESLGFEDPGKEMVLTDIFNFAKRGFQAPEKKKKIGF